MVMGAFTAGVVLAYGMGSLVALLSGTGAGPGLGCVIGRDTHAKDSGRGPLVQDTACGDVEKDAWRRVHHW